MYPLYLPRTRLSAAISVFVPDLIFISYFTVGDLHHAQELTTGIAQTMFCPSGDEYFLAGSNLPHLITHLDLAAVCEHDPQLVKVLM
jgi:hypothetical protein